MMKKIWHIGFGICISMILMFTVVPCLIQVEAPGSSLGIISIVPQLNGTSQNRETEPIKQEESKETISQVRLDVPQCVQENAYYCGCACAQMVLRYHDIEISQDELAKELHTHPVTGTEYEDLARVINHHVFKKAEITDMDPGYRVQTLAMNDTDPMIAKTFENRVKQDLASNDPVFVAVDVQALYPELNRGNHLILVIGYRCYERSERIAVYDILDPSYVVQDAVYGGWKTVPAQELIHAIISNEEPAYIW